MQNKMEAKKELMKIIEMYRFNIYTDFDNNIYIQIYDNTIYRLDAPKFIIEHLVNNNFANAYIDFGIGAITKYLIIRTNYLEIKFIGEEIESEYNFIFYDSKFLYENKNVEKIYYIKLLNIKNKKKIYLCKYTDLTMHDIWNNEIHCFIL